MTPPARGAVAENRLLDRLRLARTDGVGPVTWRRLLARFGTPEAALAALPRLARDAGRPAPAIPGRDAAARELEALARIGGRALFADMPGYPPLLALLDDAPPVLTMLGDPAAFTLRAVALVGSRNASANGRRMAETLAEALAAAGLVVVSGLARGIDAAAHEGALRAGCPAATIAAIAGGLDTPYPPEHADLQRRIAEGGAVVAEAPLGTQPLSRHFPRRNRIIAGLCLGVVVVEAAAKSGSLITARLAQEMHRDLFAVPGSPLDPRCRGTNGMLRDGATLVETVADVLDNLSQHPDQLGLQRLPIFARPTRPDMIDPDDAPAATAPDTAPEGPAALLELLGPTPVLVDDLVRRCQLSASAVMAVLQDLELDGRVQMLPGNRVALLDNRPQ